MSGALPADRGPGSHLLRGEIYPLYPTIPIPSHSEVLSKRGYRAVRHMLPRGVGRGATLGIDDLSKTLGVSVIRRIERVLTETRQ